MGKLRDRVKYPDDHIEVDNRLSWFLGRLDRQYGDEAFYVHLRRDRQATAESFTRRYDGGMIRAYRERIIWRADNDPTVSPLDVCEHYCETVNSNIELFLKNKRSMEVRLGSAEEDFREFWERIGAKGDLSASLREWSRKHNASNPDEAPTSRGSAKSREVSSFPVRAAKKAVRIVQKLPNFLRAA